MAFSFLSRWSLTTLFHYKAKIKGEPVSKVRVANPYHAVGVMPGAAACAEARKLAGERFLSAEAPLLPLKECDRSACTCRYQHFSDRRQEPRRAADIQVVHMQGTWQGTDRRKRRGRRVDDL